MPPYLHENQALAEASALAVQFPPNLSAAQRTHLDDIITRGRRDIEGIYENYAFGEEEDEEEEMRQEQEEVRAKLGRIRSDLKKALRLLHGKSLSRCAVGDVR